MANLVPVEGNPFAEAAIAPRLVPVEGNPFASGSEPADQAQQAREAAARRVPRPGRDIPQYTREAPTDKWEDVWNVVKRIPSAAAEGLTHAVDTMPHVGATMGDNPLPPAPRTITSLVTGQPGYTEEPYSVEKSIKPYVDMGPPQTYPQELADAGGRFAGENLPFMAGPGAFARGARFVVEGAPSIANKAKGFYNRYMDYVAAHQGKVAAGEAAAGLESGVAGEHVRQSMEHNGYSPMMQHVGEIAAQMLGPSAVQIGPAALASRLAAPAVKAAVRTGRSAIGTAGEALGENAPAWMARTAAKTGEERAAGAGSKIGGELREALATPESQANLAETERVKAAVPGFNPDIAQATNDPKLVNTFKKLDAEATGAELRQSQGAHDANAQSIRDRLSVLAPAAGEYPQDIAAGAAQARAGRISDRIGEQQAGVQGRITAREGELRNDADLQRQMTQLEIDQRQAQALARAEADRGTATQDLRAATDALPDLERADRGARLRDLQAQAETDSQKEVQRLRNAIDPSGKVTIPTAELHAAIKSRLKDIGTNLTSTPVPGKVRTILNRTNPPKPKVEEETAIAGVSDPQVVPEQVKQVGPKKSSMRSLLEARSALLRDIRRYSSGGTLTPEQSKSLDGLHATVDEFNRFLGLRPGEEASAAIPAGISERFNAFRTYYRDVHVPNFEEGAAHSVSRYGQRGYDKNLIPDEKVMEQFGGSNNISAARQFTRVFGDNPEAVQLMADHQLGRLKAEGIDKATGLLRPDATERFLTKNRELLDALPPDVRAAVTPRSLNDIHGRIGEAEGRAKLAGNSRTLGQVDPEVARLQREAQDLESRGKTAATSKGARTLDPALDEMHQRLGQLEQRQRTVADAAVKQKLGAAPEHTLDAALNDWQVMKSLRRSVAGNPAHEAALTRAIMDRAPDATDPKFGAWLEGHDRVLRQALTPEHLADLKTIVKAAEIHNRLPRPSGAVELPKSMAGSVADKTGTSIPGMLASVTNVMRGRSNAAYEALKTGIAGANKLDQRAYAAAWREARHNPEMARALAAATAPGGATPMQLSKMHAYLLTAGLLQPHREDDHE